MSEIKFVELSCIRCGGQLKTVNDNTYQCISCGKTFEKQIVTDVADQLRALLNEQKQEAVANLRRQLWAEMHEENINSEKVRSLARDIKKYLPEDYFANFCEIANSEVENNSKQINAFLNKTSQANIEDYADIVLDFMIKSLRTENITALTQFIERAFAGKDGASYDKYTTWLESEADKVDKGIYDLDLPRDVFLAYSSADMDKVLEICDYLESNDISCFLALRNLRHGRNAVHNYDQALKTAIDHCKTIVFVSSTHSRSRSCDAFTKELPYIRQKELDSAPHKYRHDYEKLPAEYMMFRVEYLIEDYCGNVAEKITKEFFHDLEWCKSKEAVADRILNYLIGAPETTEEETEEDIPAVEIPIKEDKSVKYCKKCGTKNRLAAKFCSKCKGTEFAETYDEYLASKIKFCALCGTQCDSEANACDNCGSEMFVPTKKAYEDLIAQMAEEERQRKIREEQERLRREEEERKRIEEERKRNEEAERLRKVREEQERLRREEEERQRKIREEEERKRNEEAERLRKVREEQERLRREEEERQRKIREEEERKRNEEEERQRKIREEQERLRREEEERIAWEKRKEEVRKTFLTLGDYKDISDGYITFGTYPQSKKASNVQIEKCGFAFDGGYSYYLGSDNCFYEEYEGEYYKVEPIKWKVLSNGSEKFIVSDIILDEYRFDENSNNYANSQIRSWINGEFYNKAFFGEQKNIIVTSVVDNSRSSTGHMFNKYACGNTNDKIFLLSRKEAEQYINSHSDLEKRASDYTKAHGLWVPQCGNSEWWLRSPSNRNNVFACFTTVEGYIWENKNTYKDLGVLPALKINNKKDISEETRKKEEEELKKLEEEFQREQIIWEKCMEEARNTYLTLGNYKDTGDGFITFGVYPQSKIKKDVQIGVMYDKERGYFIGSDSCLYGKNNGKYYKVEPIKWKVMQSGAEIFVVADMILDQHRFDEKGNNYAYSEIRCWLNGEFYYKAFNDVQKSKIVITNVDNSRSSTGDHRNIYACDNTTDKIFLLSDKEIQQFWHSFSRSKKITDYAKARGVLELHSIKGYGGWWLRSPYYFGSDDRGDGWAAENVEDNGDLDPSKVDSPTIGVVPALKYKP